MKTTTSLAAIMAVLPALGTAKTFKCGPDVTSKALQSYVKLEDLLAGAQKLQDIAEANGGNRAFGSTGHNATVDYIYDTLVATGYYNVEKQPFHEIYATADGTLTVDGAEVESGPMTYTPSGQATAELVLVSNLGCAADDFPADVSGKFALISRGECTFAAKSTNAKAAGAVGAIIYNNVPGTVAGTLGDPFGDFAPTVGISQEAGEKFASQLADGPVTATLDLDAVVEDRVTFNVIAETKGGDHDNVLVLGGHSDSVPEGPGINDDGSGIIGILNVALGLTHFKVKNAVRFGFWSAEEFGLLGSYYYVESLNSTSAEIAKMRAYLNFDMIASPNYMYGIYDGDGSAFNLTGPPGSAAIEKEFEDFYRVNGQRSVPTEFSGRSDYAAFIENGIPSGGLFTGAEGLKTPEEAVLFGGEAGVAYDVNYHQAGDTVANLNHDAFLLNTKSIANSVAKYAISFDSLTTAAGLSKRGYSPVLAAAMRRSVGIHGHAAHGHATPCGGGVAI